MKNLMLFFLFLFGGIVSKAQYKPMLTDSTIWREVNIPNWNIQVALDTVINGFSYKKLNRGNLPLLREDTSSKKVYYLWPHSTAEAILYDFSLMVGDSIFINHSLANGFPNPFDAWYVVDSVLYPMIEGTTRKMLVLITQKSVGPNNYFSGYNCSPSNCLLWIEGIGSTNRLFYLAEGTIIGFNPYLSCTFLGNTLIYRYSPIGACTPTGFHEEKVDEKIKISVFNSEITIHNESAFNIEEIYISDVTGRICYKQFDLHEKNLTISGILEKYSNTVLILNLYLNNGTVVSRKLIN
jgi:hypothetical protein